MENEKVREEFRKLSEESRALLKKLQKIAPEVVGYSPTEVLLNKEIDKEKKKQIVKFLKNPAITFRLTGKIDLR